MMKSAVQVLTIFTLVFSANAFAQKKAGAKHPVTPTPAQAPAPVQQSYYADFDWELQTMNTGGGISSFKAGGETNTVIEAGAAVTKVIRSNIQAGVEANFYNQSGGGGSSYFQILGIGVYNFDNNLKDSFYAKGGLGMLNVINDKFKNESKIGFMVGAGKRILLMDKVAYTPEGRLIIVDGGTRFQILALNFSLFY
ncbi:MAG: hypothetical protein B7Y39_04695 [Bdellovibrio sp. 28-41-41]|nr:MAG: hypothetical protein B7Y39_04695 [Bdellovibrio sp. 28-41-41]